MYKLPKTKRGANRQAHAIVRRWYRESKGGAAYGLDWPTMRATYPEDCAHIDAMRAMYKNLPA